ncbi:DNA MISMATCH REPAIR PROTEIN MSH1 MITOCHONDRIAL [Salix viminalis]|uniref:DNA MISMATCH REPAIR PROTEIN MSH1 MITOCHONDRIAL n=1 Tax=Salix viminalis TaxID=40686 RepID=A0A9Q0Z500_SALVM|nr:DNA MISMATCH REPAIR PROTEIN MSH1 MITOCHONDRIAL [Salix viminalis]
MYWLATRNAVVSLPKLRSFTLLLRSPFKCSSLSPSPPPLIGQIQPIYCFKNSKGTARNSKKSKASNNVLDDKDLSHIIWWKDKLQRCRKPSTANLVKRLMYSNLLGLDASLKNGSLKEGNLNWEMLQFKSKFPREVLLCRVGDFYESIGIDACILVEYAGLNPFGGLRSDSVPRAGCPVVNLRQTLDDLTRNGYSVCIVEEVQGPTQARSRKGRFISGHARPGSPYVFGLVGVDHDLDFPEPMPVVGISQSARGYCMISVLETMKTYSLEDGLTEEALVTKLRTCQYHHLFLHTSLRHNSSGTSRWGEYGRGGLLWGECNGRYFEWFEGNPVTELLFKVRELYGLDDKVGFRNVYVCSENRPKPLHLGTATQIGAIPTEGIPCLLKVLLPSNCTGLPELYVRDLLLNPPAYEIASTIQASCKLMSNITCSIPEFTCVSSAKLVKLLEQKEVNHIEFCRIKNVLDEILFMYRNSELNEILKSLMDPAWMATGLKIEFETLVNECEWASGRISEMISLDGESDQKISSSPVVPSEFFFEDMESSWKGRVKRVHLEEEFSGVEKAAQALSLAVSDFSSHSREKVLYAREHEAVWFKGKRFAPAVWAGTPGEEQIKQLKPAVDSKGRKVGEEWFTTIKLEDALTRYHDAGEKAKAKVLELLRGLSAELQTKVNILVYASMVLVIAKALFAHVSEGRRRKWVFPTLTGFNDSKDVESLDDANRMELIGLSPYWFNAAEGSAVQNTVDMRSLFLLTGPNGGGKSSLLRSICASALLGICGLMFISGGNVRNPSLVTGASSRSLVLVDEICRGTETAKGACIAGSIVETLDKTGCLGIVSTHLHGIFDLPLDTNNTVYKAMGNRISYAKGVISGKTGNCVGHFSSDRIVNDSDEAHLSSGTTASLHLGTDSTKAVDDTVEKKDIENAITMICQKKLTELYKQKNTSEVVSFHCVAIGAREQPPPSTINASCVYVMLRPDKKLYVGVTDDLESRIRSHRSKEGMGNAAFLYFIVPGKSIACLLETLLIHQLPIRGFKLTNVSDGFIFSLLEKLLVLMGENPVKSHPMYLRKEPWTTSFLYFIVPGKSIACQPETLLINQFPAKDFKLTDAADEAAMMRGNAIHPIFCI